LSASIPQISAPVTAPPAPVAMPPARKKYTLAEVFGDDDDDEEDDGESSEIVAAAGVGGARQDYERPPPLPGMDAYNIFDDRSFAVVESRLWNSLFTCMCQLTSYRASAISESSFIWDMRSHSTV